MPWPVAIASSRRATRAGAAQHGHVLQALEQGAHLLGQQLAQMVPPLRLGGQQAQQGRTRHQQQAAGHARMGIVGARTVIEQGDFTEPLRRLQQAQSGLARVGTHGADQQRAFHKAIQARVGIPSQEQGRAGGHFLHDSMLQQLFLALGRQG
jgi:hypothetical protein